MNSEIAFLSQKIRRNAHLFIWIGDILMRLSPHMAMNLRLSGIGDRYNVSAREYLSICFLLSLTFSVISTIVISFALYIGGSKNIILGPLMGIFIFFFFYIQLVSYPKIIISKRVRDLEKNLLFALRTILVQIRSGVPIFDTFVSIADGDYGQISQEFRVVVEKVRAGKPVEESLETLAIRNPSMYFRRAIWQLLTAIKSGGDVGDNLSRVIESLSKEQVVGIKRYQSILNPLAMMYMMIAVIIPSMGVTIMVIISTFPGMENIVSEQIFWMLLVGLIFMQFIFLSIIRSKRPTLI